MKKPLSHCMTHASAGLAGPEQGPLIHTPLLTGATSPTDAGGELTLEHCLKSKSGAPPRNAMASPFAPQFFRDFFYMR